MDAKRLTTQTIKEGIEIGCYELTGVLETGEGVIAILDGNVDRNFIKEVLESNISNMGKLEKTKNLMKIKGRPAQELMQVYEQKCSSNHPRCKKNNLILRIWKVLFKTFYK